MRDMRGLVVLSLVVALSCSGCAIAAGSAIGGGIAAVPTLLGSTPAQPTVDQAQMDEMLKLYQQIHQAQQPQQEATQLSVFRKDEIPVRKLETQAVGWSKVLRLTVGSTRVLL